MKIEKRWGPLVLAVLLAGAAFTGCADDDVIVVPGEEQDAENDEEDCGGEFLLPDGESYALQAHAINEPSAVAPLAQNYIDSVPPLLLFADGLTDGFSDELDIVGGVGERTGFGFDETPGTAEDVFSIYYGSFDVDECQFQAQLDGETDEYALEASAEEMEIDLSGFSSLTEGLSLHVEEVTLTGQFTSDLDFLYDVVLFGVLSDEGIDELLEAVREQIPISEEQAMDLLDPEGTGEIPVELELDGRRIVVAGFMDAREEEIEVEPRPEQSCCPEGLNVGDSVIPHLTWEQQGIDDRQSELFLMALPQFRDDPHVAMIATARRVGGSEVEYEVYSGGAVDEGMIRFTRHAGDDGEAPRFEIIDQVGTNPLANTEPTALSSYEELLTTGINPESTSYTEFGYGSDDPRVGFVPAEEMNYPYAMERISQNFDDPRTGDLMVIPASWSTGGFGTHGNLGSLQSRAPLVMFGPGIRTAADGVGADAEVQQLVGGADTLLVDDAVRQVDIAPTVAAALGVAKTTGVGPDLRLRDDVYLGWQDGRVLEEVFTSDALDTIEQGDAVAERAVVIINDGLTNAELLYQVFTDDPALNADAYRRFFAAGMAYRHGAISNFPSNTYPGHNTVGAGAWGGHHGVVDNSFWVREKAGAIRPIRDLFETEHLLGSAHENLPVETIHEAVERTYGGLGDGVLSASINDPSSRGAAFATLERRHAGDFEVPDEADDVVIGEQTFSPPPADIDDYTGVMDNASLLTFAELYQDHLHRDEEGLPIPKFSIVNFGSTDTAGHAHGPHGDHERYEVVSRVNERMGIMLEVLEYLAIDDATLVVLTSDHGMELQDRSRSSSRGRAFSDADVSVRRAGWYYYFKQLAVEVDEVVDDGDVELSLKVYDRATEEADDNVGVDDVEVSVVDGGDAEVAISDNDGRVELTVVPDGEDESVLLQFEHSDWNAHRQRIQF